MITTFVSDNLDEIRQACKEMNIESLYLFGSGARNDDFNNESDLDFLYSSLTYNAGYLLSPFYDYFDLLWKPEAITGKKIDLAAEKKLRTNTF